MEITSTPIGEPRFEVFEPPLEVYDESGYLDAARNEIRWELAIKSLAIRAEWDPKAQKDLQTIQRISRRRIGALDRSIAA